MNDVVRALILILPAYVANATPVIARGSMPIDFGRKFVDGKPVFGGNKTIEGFIIGVATGFCAGLMINKPFDGVLLAFGALIGDLLGAFLKRRVNMKPGSPLPVLDQLSFLYGALFLLFLGQRLSLTVDRLDWMTVLILTVLTPPIHLISNFLAHKFGFKEKPW